MGRNKKRRHERRAGEQGPMPIDDFNALEPTPTNPLNADLGQPRELHKVREQIKAASDAAARRKEAEEHATFIAAKQKEAARQKILGNIKAEAEKPLLSKMFEQWRGEAFDRSTDRSIKITQALLDEFHQDDISDLTSDEKSARKWLIATYQKELKELTDSAVSKAGEALFLEKMREIEARLQQVRTQAMLEKHARADDAIKAALAGDPKAARSIGTQPGRNITKVLKTPAPVSKNMHGGVIATQTKKERISIFTPNKPRHVDPAPTPVAPVRGAALEEIIHNAAAKAEERKLSKKYFDKWHQATVEAKNTKAAQPAFSEETQRNFVVAERPVSPVKQGMFGTTAKPAVQPEKTPAVDDRYWFNLTRLWS